MKGYKICKILDDGKRVSLIAGGSYRREYKKGEQISCKKDSLGIFVFDSWSQAFSFKNLLKYSNWIVDIVEVNCFNEKEIPDIISSNGNERDLDKFYSKISDGLSSCPKGTRCFEYVIPTN